jgi:hypothetical protein
MLAGQVMEQTLLARHLLEGQERSQTGASTGGEEVDSGLPISSSDARGHYLQSGDKGVALTPRVTDSRKRNFVTLACIMLFMRRF